MDVKSSVTELNRDKKVISVEENGECNEVRYEKLLLSGGGKGVSA
ncbi:hypothetical protein [Staphylococcus capitis]|nr:hypothetical protein [Staphylococcus capitis]